MSKSSQNQAKERAAAAVAQHQAKKMADRTIMDGMKDVSAQVALAAKSLLPESALNACEEEADAAKRTMNTIYQGNIVPCVQKMGQRLEGGLRDVADQYTEQELKQMTRDAVARGLDSMVQEVASSVTREIRKVIPLKYQLVMSRLPQILEDVETVNQAQGAASRLAGNFAELSGQAPPAAAYASQVHAQPAPVAAADVSEEFGAYAQANAQPVQQPSPVANGSLNDEQAGAQAEQARASASDFSITQFVKDIVNHILSTIRSVLGSMTSFAKDIPGVFVHAGCDAVRNVGKGVSLDLFGVDLTAKQDVKPAAPAAANAAQPASPSVPPKPSRPVSKPEAGTQYGSLSLTEDTNAPFGGVSVMPQP